MVASVSARSTGLHVVDRPALHRDPGRREVHRLARCGPCEPTNPNFHSSLRQAAVDGDPLGLGPPGRLGGDHAPPGEELAVGEVGGPPRSGRPPARRAPTTATAVGGAEDEDVGAVGQRHHRQHLARLPTASSMEASTRPGMGGPGLAHGGGQVVDHGAVVAPRACAASALTARPCMPVTADPVDLARRSTPGRLEAPTPRPRRRAARSGSRRTAPPRPWSAGRRRSASGRGTRR